MILYKGKLVKIISTGQIGRFIGTTEIPFVDDLCRIELHKNDELNVLIIEEVVTYKYDLQSYKTIKKPKYLKNTNKNKNYNLKSWLQKLSKNQN